MEPETTLEYCPVCGFGPSDFSYTTCFSCETDYCYYTDYANPEANAVLRRAWLQRTGLTPEAFEQLIDHLHILPEPPAEWPPLVYAAATGNQAEIHRALESGSHVDAANERGETALMWAARRGQAQIVAMLLSAGANPNAKAALGRSDPGACLFVSNERRDPKQAVGQTALIWASERGEIDSIDLLLRAGADINQGDQWQQSPLIWSAYWGRADAVSRLLQAGARVNASDEHGNTALIAAAYHGHQETIRRLIAAGAEVDVTNRHGYTPLILALKARNPAAAQLLVEAGADVNLGDQEGHTPLMYALWADSLDFADYLIRQGANVDRQAKSRATALSVAVMRDDDRISTAAVRRLVEAGADLNVHAMFGQPPLLWALMFRRRDAAHILLDAGADITHPTVRGETALMYAASAGDIAMLQRLVALGADRHARDYRGKTALHFAHSREAVAALIEAGADANAQDNHGCTALMEAVSRRDVNLALALLEKGADVRLKNMDRKTALDIACNKGYREIIDVLRNQEGRPPAVPRPGQPRSS